MDSRSHSPVAYVRARIANACDGCKARKVRCDGKLPCTYCARRHQAQNCHYSAQKRRGSPSRRKQSLDRSPAAQVLGPRSSIESTEGASSAATPGRPTTRDGRRSTRSTTLQQNADVSAAEADTDVPREARLLYDAQGKLIFVGDCAPLSFFQSVRQLVTTKVAHDAFAPQTSRYSSLKNASAHQRHRVAGWDAVPPDVRHVDGQAVFSAYLAATTGLVDMFDNGALREDLMSWTGLAEKPADVTSIVKYLIVALGLQLTNEELASECFEYARDQAYFNFTENLSIGTVEVFALVTVYMLCSCQINGAFLFFGIAVRGAYSIGIHRTEVNARFGEHVHRQRDRLWKSLRVLDLNLSTSMGRPPATSGTDCTVPYGDLREDPGHEVDLLDASVQILLVVEQIVTDIYSRKKISLQLTEGLSLQLRDWAKKWLLKLTHSMSQNVGICEEQTSGAFRTLSTYYYAVMLVSRPFLMYELYQRLTDQPVESPMRPATSGKAKLADACIDAACMMVEQALDLVQKGSLHTKMPFTISWLFAGSLALGVSHLGQFGKAMEKFASMSIQVLDHFAENDAHAKQYSLIAQSLLASAIEHLEVQELQERTRRTENSSQLFGLTSRRHESSTTPRGHRSLHQLSQTPALGLSPNQWVEAPHNVLTPQNSSLDQQSAYEDLGTGMFGMSDSQPLMLDMSYWSLDMDGENDSSLALNLFPLLDSGGDIDLAHYF